MNIRQAIWVVAFICCGAFSALAQNPEYITRTLVQPPEPPYAYYQEIGVSGDFACVIEKTHCGYNDNCYNMLLLDVSDPYQIEQVGEALQVGSNSIKFAGSSAYFSRVVSWQDLLEDDDYPEDTMIHKKSWYESNIYDFANGNELLLTGSMDGIYGFEYGGDLFTFQRHANRMVTEERKCAGHRPPYCWVEENIIWDSTRHSIDRSGAGPEMSLECFGLPTDATFNGTLAYILIGDKLVSARIQDNGNNEVLSSIELPGTGYRIERAGAYAYVIGLRYLAVVSVRHPLNMRVITVDATVYPGGDMSLNGDRLTIDDGYGVSVFDLTNPVTPEEVATYRPPGSSIYGVVDNGDNIFVAGESFGLRVLKLEDSLLEKIGDFPSTAFDTLTANGVLDVAFHSRYAYVATGDTNLRVLDLSDPENPVDAADLLSTSQVQKVRLDTSAMRVYGFSGGTVTVHDVTDLSNPSASYTWSPSPSGAPVHDILAKRNIVYIARAAEEDNCTTCWPGDILEIYYTFGISGFTLWGSVEVTSKDCQIALDNGYAYLAGSKGIHIIDVSNPLNPTEVAAIQDRSYAVVARNSLLYFSGIISPLQIYDVSDPASPTLLSRTPSSFFPYSYELRGNHLYASAGPYGMYIMDVSDPTYPRAVGVFDTPGWSYSLGVSRDLIVVADSTSLILLRPDITTDVMDDPEAIIPAGFSLEQNYPNPFNPRTKINYAIAKRSQVKLEIYNLLGQRITTLVDELQSAGNYSVIWDAESVASAVYMYRLKTGAIVETKKMTLLK